MPLHPYNTGLHNHAITAKTYATVAARDADLAWQTVKNINKVVFITDINAYQILVSVVAGVATWQTGFGGSTALGGTGFDGIAEAHQVSISRVGDLIKTEIFVDLTGLNSKNTAADIIGDDGTGEAWFAQITDAVNGSIYKGRVNCIELPAGGDPDIDVYSAVESTGVEDTLITDLDETVLVTSGGDGTDWVAGEEIAMVAVPTANEYLYLAAGSAGTDGTYTAGQFLFEFWGRAA